MHIRIQESSFLSTKVLGTTPPTPLSTFQEESISELDISWPVWHSLESSIHGAEIRFGCIWIDSIAVLDELETNNPVLIGCDIALTGSQKYKLLHSGSSLTYLITSQEIAEAQESSALRQLPPASTQEIEAVFDLFCRY